MVFFLEDAQVLITSVSAASCYSPSLQNLGFLRVNLWRFQNGLGCGFGQHLLVVLLLPGFLPPGLLLALLI